MVFNFFVFSAFAAALAAGQTTTNKSAEDGCGGNRNCTYIDLSNCKPPNCVEKHFDTKPTPTVTVKTVHRAPTPVVAKPPEPPAVSAPTVEPDAPRARTVKMTDSDIVPVNCARQYETLFILKDKNEHIIEAGTGDPERWQTRVADPKKPSSALHVKPAILGSRTNLNIRTDRGHTYTFALTECKGCAAPDMKVFIEPSGSASGTDALTLPTPEEVALTSAVKDQVKMITDLRAALDEAAKDLAKFKVDSEKEHEQEIGKFRSRYALNHNCAYRFAVDQKPFFVKQICHDEAFTYIRVAGDTPPAVYGEQDGQLSLLPAKFERDEKEPRGGTLIVSAVIPRGRLAYGKEKLEFTNAAK